MITLTDKAKAKILRIIEEEELEDQHLRINILGGKCAGFSFDLFFEEVKPTDDDLIFNFDSINVVINPLVGLYIDGTEIDYINSLFGGGFKFTNTKFSSQCGCGNSFSL